MEDYTPGAHDKYKSFAELARHKKEGEDYNVFVREIGNSKVSVVVPHGDGIEPNTAMMAKAIAASEHSLYVFNSIAKKNDFREMHITSIHFDDPRCLDLVAKTDVTLTIHGSRWQEPVVCLSGMDKKLESKLAAAFNKAGIKALAGNTHPYQTGNLPENICNKNRRGQGVQLEFSRGIRDNPQLIDTCIRVIRESLAPL